jgi:hypothetical protein
MPKVAAGLNSWLENADLNGFGRNFTKGPPVPWTLLLRIDLMSDSANPTVDIAPQLRALEEASRSHETLHAPRAIQEALDLVLA